MVSTSVWYTGSLSSILSSGSSFMNEDKKRFEWNPEGLDCEHWIGDLDCDGCGWTKARKCPHCKDGVVHTEFGDEEWDDYWVHFKCDKCDWEELICGRRLGL